MEQIKSNETPKYWHIITVGTPDDIRIIFERFFQAVKNAQPGQTIVLPISNDVALQCSGPWKRIDPPIQVSFPGVPDTPDETI